MLSIRLKIGVRVVYNRVIWGMHRRGPCGALFCKRVLSFRLSGDDQGGGKSDDYIFGSTFRWWKRNSCRG